MRIQLAGLRWSPFLLACSILSSTAIETVESESDDFLSSLVASFETDILDGDMCLLQRHAKSISQLDHIDDHNGRSTVQSDVTIKGADSVNPLTIANRGSSHHSGVPLAPVTYKKHRGPWFSWILVAVFIILLFCIVVFVAYLTWSAIKPKRIFENEIPPEFTREAWHEEDLLTARQKSVESEKELPKSSEPAADEHLVPLEDLIKTLDTNTKTGLSSKEAKFRLERDGPNSLKPPKKTHPLLKFAYQLICGFAPLLWVAALLCFLAWWPLGGKDPDSLNLALALVLVVVIFLQAGFNFWQEYQSDQVMERLAAMLPQRANVVRDGKEQSVDLKTLVVGDIAVIDIGEKVPADIRLIERQSLQIDKAPLNGESEPVSCTIESTDPIFLQTRNVVFFGCDIVDGSGKGIVVRTGDNTVFGSIAALVAENEGRPSTLAAEITRTCKILAVLAVITGGAAFCGWAFWLRIDYPNFQNFAEILVNCITLIVAFVPESMPICVTVTLALIAKQMAENNVLVRNLEAVETLGAVSVIASDKTGTLTQNRMTVCNFTHQGGTKAYETLMRSMALCSKAKRDSPDDTAGETIVGDATETGLIKHYLSASVGYATLTSLEKTREAWETLAMVPFNSKNKYMLTIHKIPGKRDRLLLMKGAPEKVLDRCVKVLKPDGSETKMTKDELDKILKDIGDVASQGCRCLGFAYLELSGRTYGENYKFDIESLNFPTQGLVFSGFVALRDPPRTGVKEAIQKCHDAYIRVAMVTGDHPATAKAIAGEVGIITASKVDTAEDLRRLIKDPTGDRAEAVVVTGMELEQLGDDGLREACKYKELVFARTTPKQKFEIVCMFQAADECVAVTGDGVNDAPALKQADCGVAMGSGTAVSKEAAALVIQDDNFASVVKGIELGRTCFANLKKVIIYLLPAGSFCEALPVVLNVFLGIPLSLSSFLMLVISCCTDVCPALSMVYEKPESVIMQVPPRRVSTDHLVDLKLIGNAYLFIGVIQAAVAYATFFLFYYLEGVPPGEMLFKFTDGNPELEDQGQSLYFYALVVGQFGNILTSRTFKVSTFAQNPLWGPTQNRRIFLALCISACFVILVLYVPFIENNLDVAPLPTKHWQPLVLPWFGSCFLIFFNECRKKWASWFPGGCVATLSVS